MKKQTARQGFTPIIIIVIITVIGIIIGGIYIGYTILNVDRSFVPSKEQTANQSPKETDSSTTAPIATISSQPSLWKTYKSTKYNYEIKYPDNTQIITGEREDFKIYIKGKQYPFGTYVGVDILQNPKNLPLAQLGNEWFAIDAPKPYDLGWKQTTFLEQDALTTQYASPGDMGKMNIYLLVHNNIYYAIWNSPVDESGSTTMKDISNQIISSFRFTQ